MSDVHEPRAEWSRAFHACLLGTAGVLLVAAVLAVLGALTAGNPLPSAPAGVVIGAVLAAVVVALLATLVVAGSPRCFDRTYEITDEGLVVDGPEGRREIAADRILDLRPEALILEDGERVAIPATLVGPLRPLYRESLLRRVRATGRLYRHEDAPARWAVRLAVVYLLAFLAGVLIVVVGMALMAGGAGRLVAVGLGFGVWLILWRTMNARREDRMRAASLESVTLDRDGVEVVEAGGETTRIPWSEVVDVSVPGWRTPLIVETEDMIHALPRSFHPSLPRDLRAAWTALAPE